ncbi:SEC14-like protein 2 isoform X2 [Hermetia illucens]|uniref:SEC14-like protein 2 isoform X2 n=1 Tax=Hermetia illucens TaxID=343691 RepID=UPI0018CC0687|nr:SEC14-like protein 2 isoform X2 [Hermetia illucens]
MSAIVRRPQLEDDQKFALMKFRKTVEDILGPDDDDYFLLRWLRARKWNIEAAEKMLRSAHRNKQTWIGTNWKEPQVLKEYLPYGLIGCDNEGSPTILVPFSGLDLYGILHCTSASEFVRKTVLLLEHFSKVGFEQSKTKGVLARQFVVICDMTDFNIKQYAWRPAAELIISLVKNYELHYPETLKICYIINAPKVFSVAFNFIKKFMDDYTRSKICIFNHGSTKWQKLLFEHLDPKIFPKYYGGELTDEDGDPKCKSKICWGGKVPEEMYTKRDDKNNNANYIDTVIEKGKKLKIELNCDIAGSVLRHGISAQNSFNEWDNCCHLFLSGFAKDNRAQAGILAPLTMTSALVLRVLTIKLVKAIPKCRSRGLSQTKWTRPATLLVVEEPSMLSCSTIPTVI